jgi:DNA-binding CsgD family transcriptional regulator
MKSGQHVAPIVRLAQEVADAPAGDCEAAVRYALTKLSSWIGATNAYWIAAAREEPRQCDPMLGWRARELVYLHDHASLMRGTAQMIGRLHKGEFDLSTVENVKRAGRTRSVLRAELVPDHIWDRSWIANEYHLPRGIKDQLVSAAPVSERHESYFGLTRGLADRPFDEDDRDLLLLFTEASVQFQRRLMFFRGWTASPALTLRERDVLNLLTTDRTEKEIAASLEIGERTVHQHATAIYAKLGVRGRNGLHASRP